MIDYLDIIDKALNRLKYEIDDIKEFVEEGWDNRVINNTHYIDTLKGIISHSDIGYECDGLEIKLRAFRDKLNESEI